MTNTEENTADSLVVDTDFGGDVISKEDAALAETEDLARALLVAPEPSAEVKKRSQELYDKAIESLGYAEQVAVSVDDHVKIATAYERMIYSFGTPRF